VEKLGYGTFILHDKANNSILYTHNVQPQICNNVYLFLSSDQHYQAIHLDGNGRLDIDALVDIEVGVSEEKIRQSIQKEKKFASRFDLWSEPNENQSAVVLASSASTSDSAKSKHLPEWMKQLQRESPPTFDPASKTGLKAADFIDKISSYISL